RELVRFPEGFHARPNGDTNCRLSVGRNCCRADGGKTQRNSSGVIISRDTASVSRLAVPRSIRSQERCETKQLPNPFSSERPDDAKCLVELKSSVPRAAPSGRSPRCSTAS